MDTITIIPYERRYRDDMIYMILAAKDALGRVPTLNEDLLNIEGNYLRKGDGFWLAVDGEGRVVGSLGYSSIAGTRDVWLHRFYIKADRKRLGIGTQMLRHAEEHLRQAGKAGLRVHLGGGGYEASRPFYLRMGFAYDGDMDHMRKDIGKERA